MVRISARSALLMVAVVVLAIVAQRVFVAAHAPLSWAAAAAIVAVLIDPIVDRLDKRIPRLPAVIIALLFTAVAVWAVIYVALDDLSNGIDRLGEAAQDAADELEDRDDRIGRLARDVEASRRVDLFVEALDERVTGGDEVLASTAGTAPTYFIGGILTLFLMSYGPGIASSAANLVTDPDRRRDVTAIVQTAVPRARRAIFFSLGEALVAGLVVAGAAVVLDVPAAAALGLTAGVLALLPHVGLVLGTLPLVLLVLALRSDIAAIVTFAVVVAVQLADSFFVRRYISRNSVHVGLLVPWVVALVGYAVYGVGGAAYGLAFAVFVLAVLDEINRRNQARAGEADDTGAGDTDTDAGVEAGGARPASGAAPAPDDDPGSRRDDAGVTAAAPGEAVGPAGSPGPPAADEEVPGFTRAE